MSKEAEALAYWWRSKTAREYDPLGTIGPFKDGQVLRFPQRQSRALVPAGLYNTFPGGIDDLLC